MSAQTQNDASGSAPPEIRSLYIHVPFCSARCDYCSFYAVEGAPEELRRAYLQRLDQELALRSPRAAPLDSVYLGGGSPTALPPAEIAELLDSVHRHFAMADDVEFSIEANPETITPELARCLHVGGVNRVSLGLQSFAAETRQAMGRHSNPECVPTAIDRLRAAGIHNLGCDLVYGVEGQSLAAWESDLQRAAELALDHVSTYSLMVKPGTPLALRGGREGDDDMLADMWELAGEFWASRSLARYEISNFARPQRECRHNMDVWFGGHFLGAGPAACWYDGESRWSNVASLEAWQRAEPPEQDWLPPAERAAEILITGLRTVRGWTREQFQKATGFDYLELRPDPIRELTQEGLLELDDATLRLSPRGLLLADYVARELL